MRKLSSILVAAVLLGAAVVTEAQQTTKIPRIGYLAARNKPSPATPDPAADAFQQGLRDLGYMEAKTLAVEYRYAEGSEERLKSLVAELLQLKVELIVTPGPSVVRAIQQQTKTLPVIWL